jgi:two-component system response regulator MprA
MPRRILVADDDKAIRDVLRSKLSGEGYQVDTVADGLQVLKALTGSRYDLLILDVGMPGIDGYHLAEQITAKESYRSKVIILTSRDVAMESAQAILSGADAFLEKAAGLDLVLKTVRGLIGPAETPS